MTFKKFLEALESNSIVVTLFCELSFEAICQFKDHNNESEILPFKYSLEEAIEFIEDQSGDIDDFLNIPWDNDKNLYRLTIDQRAESNPLDNQKLLIALDNLISEYEDEFSDVKSFEELNDLICSQFFEGGNYDLYCDDLDTVEEDFFNRLLEIDSPGFKYSKVFHGGCEVNKFWLESQESNHLEFRIEGKHN